MIFKICGNTKSNQVIEIAKLKVNFLGFIFVKSSKRYVSPEHAKLLIKNLKRDSNTNIKSVGVFMDQPISEILEIAKISRLDILQLHGNESPKYLKEIKSKSNAEIIKVIGVNDNFDSSIVEQYENLVDYFLFDSLKTKNKKIIRGGTGQTFDWELLKTLNTKKPWLLAGGIGLNNISDAVKSLSEYGLAGFDLNSKVEIKPGDKDIQLIAQCLDKIKL